MDLIDRAALREAMYHEAFETDSKDQRWDGGCWIRYKMFERNLEATPTIEAVPLDKLCDWLAERYEPPYTREDLDNMEFPMKIEHQKQIWKRVLTKWMEEQAVG